MEIKNEHATEAGEVCDVVLENGLSIRMFRSHAYTGNRDGLTGFLPAAILRSDKEVWSYKNLGAPKGCLGELLEYGDEGNFEFIIAVRSRTALHSLYRVNDFVHGVMVKIGDKMTIVGGSSAEELLPIKKESAKMLGVMFTPSKEEWLIEMRESEARRKQEEAQAQARRQALDEERRAKAAADEEARQLARRKQAEKLAEICARAKVHAFTREGQHRIGIPVYNDEEWKCLPDGKECVLMNGNEPVEAFIVSKQYAKVKKTKQAFVTGKQPEPGKQAVKTGPQAVGKQTVTIRGESRQVLLFASMGDVRQLRDDGLNSGTWVGVKKEGATKIDVYAMNHGGIATVGVAQA